MTKQELGGGFSLCRRTGCWGESGGPGMRGALPRARPGSLGLITLPRTATMTVIAVTLQWPRDLCA